ncbi:MAG: hypothetical protein FJ098_02495, partial [Deltaproteobacteria bacterium]|nr:hypothetical protein [Deltaproteobacteria bacterium]
MAMTSSIPGLSSKAAWSVTFFAFLALAWLGLTGQGVRWPDPMAALAGESKPEIVTEEALDEALQDLEAQLASLEDDGVVGPAAGAPALEQDLERARRTAARAAAGLAPPREELLDQVLAALGTLALDDGSLAGDGAAGGAAAAAKALAAGALADALDRIPPVEENCRMGTPQKCRLRGLDSFFQKLEMVSMGQKARIAAYGDSLIMGDQVVGALRRGLQEQFGNGGPGFFLPAKTAPWYAISGAVVYGDDAWEIRRVTEPTIPDGLYGYGAQAFLARRAGVVSRVECDSRCPWDDITQYEVYYLSQEGGGPFTVKAGG